VRGTFTGWTYANVKVMVGSATIAATLQGTAWSAQLPTGSIAGTDTPVKVVVTDPTGGSVEAQQTFTLDGAGPVIALAPSTIKDERGDTIDFTKGEPFHTHAGATVDLAAAGCPVVYKYGYLMDATIPYGVNVTANPLAWHIKVTDMKLAAGSQAFRVRTDDGTVVRDWSAMPAADANGVSTIELTRKGGTAPIAALGTRTGQFFVDVRARDWSNNETVKSICFDHHPLQAPVAVAPFQNGSLFGLSLGSDVPASWIYSGGGTVELVSQTITQQTAEPTTVTWTASSSAFTYGKGTYDGYATEEKAEQIYCLSGNTEPKCNTSAPAATTGFQSLTGTFTPALSVAVIDAVNGQTVATSTGASVTLTLPARAANAAAHAYRFVVSTAPMAALQPTAIGSAWGDYSLLGSIFTGALSPTKVQCVSLVDTSWGPKTMCARVAYHVRFSGIDEAWLNMSFASRVQQSGVDAPYVSASVLASGAKSWDSGNDDLPGVYY
jgi:hypothetical protein